MEDALKEIRVVVKETIKLMLEEDEKVPEPFSLKEY